MNVLILQEGVGRTGSEGEVLDGHVKVVKTTIDSAVLEIFEFSPTIQFTQEEGHLDGIVTAVRQAAAERQALIRGEGIVGCVEGATIGDKGRAAKTIGQAAI